MKIVADENIPLLQQFFASFGEIKALPGRSITNESLAQADILLVRSVTKVDEALLSGSSVKFVGTTTIGLDHVDTAYLDKAGIRYCNAPGCNAESVVEYVLSALSVLGEEAGFDFSQVSVGLVGKGNIGSRLGRALELLGSEVKYCDPPKQIAGEEGLVDLDEVMDCDIVSLHVPLVEDGPHPTRNLFNEDRIAQLRPGQILINTSRGEVIDEAALKARLSSSDAPVVVLDVWWNEPGIDVELARLCHFVTPHIAGYSLDGKTKGTAMVYATLCDYLGLPKRHRRGQFLPDPPLRRLSFSGAADPSWALHTAIRACYDIRHDHVALLRSLSFPDGERHLAFDALRKHYRPRRGFIQCKAQVKGCQVELVNKLQAAGFSLQTK